MLASRRVVLGVTGGVAAYKAAYLARRLVEHGADVRVIMTDAASQFVGAQTFAAITGSQPHTKWFGVDDVSPHTDLARWADLVVIAPCTAATLARLAAGSSDDLLVATVLAAQCPILLAPAMHTEMWEHPATRANVDTVAGFGYHIVGPDVGELAGGDTGPGRLAEPESIVAAAAEVLSGGDLAGLTVVVTAGGTREPIDPVRFVGNRSSGKMGHAIAIEAARRGAHVILVTAATAPPESGVEVVGVETAEEMAAAVTSRSGAADIAVFAAAVADFRPKAVEPTKLRRADGLPHVEFESTPDILGTVAASEPRPFIVGFAAETGTVEGAVDKAVAKGVDLLVANDVLRSDSGFGSDTNQVTLVFPDGTMEPWPTMSKLDVAARLWDRIAAMRAGS